MKFVKVDGIGNDFILVNNIEEKIPETRFSELARRFCRRGLSIGADGILVLERSQKADYRMRIINSDGSEAEMCGNGIRCISKYIYEKGLSSNKELVIETLAGLIHPKLTVNDSNKVEEITVDMGKPMLKRSQIPMEGPEGVCISENLTQGKKQFRITTVSMGNPHCVIFVDDFESLGKWKDLGEEIEHNLSFPQRINVEFVQILSPNHVKVKVWERGAGATLACGTGACAVGVSLILNNKAKKEQELIVSLPGGDLKIKWASDEHVYMTGPAEFVFEAEINHD